MKFSKVGALAAAGMLAFAACSTDGGTTPSGAAGDRPEACEGKVGTSSNEIHVYSSLPRQGSNQAQTNAMVESMKSILDGQKVGDFTIKYTDLDDSSAANNGDWDGAVAQANAATAANDPDAMIFIGHYNSGAAKLTIPILNAACLVMISPANTYPGLTKAVEGVTEPGEPDSYYPNGFRNYARVIATDDAQAAAGVAWAKELGATKAYVLDDTQVYGKGLARAWAIAAGKLDIEVVSADGSSEGFDAKATDYAALSQKVKESGADFIYIGSITGQNTGKLWKDLRAAMPDIKIMSGDGVFEKSWYEGAGDAGNGTYLTFGGVGPNEQVSEAGIKWVADYRATHDNADPPVYGIYGAAAAQVALNALQTAATPNDRYEVLKAVFATKDFASYLGTMSIDANGDNTLSEATGYQVETSWPPAFQKVLVAP